MYLLNTKELALMLKVSEKTIRNWVYKGNIPYTKINGSIRFIENEIVNWIKN